MRSNKARLQTCSEGMAISQPKSSHNKLAQMPSKLRKAIGAVKDQTSISLAKVTGATTVTVEIAILRATSHDDAPVDARHVDDVIEAVVANHSHASKSAQAIAKRVGKTRNWIVALKCLVLVLRIFQQGDEHFPRKVRKAMKKGSKILNLSNFKDDSSSRPWDFTSFVRAIALYMDERLDCLLAGKLHRLRLSTYRDGDKDGEMMVKHQRAGSTQPVRDMKPATLIDRISCWQKLLDRVMAAEPTGEAGANRLVQASLHAVVQESFDLYHDVSDGLALLLDSFFHLPYQACVNAFQACVRASRQFEELAEFYGHCKSLGIGRTSEYPSVQKVSAELMETLHEFLKDQASFPSRSPTPPHVIEEASASASTSSDPNSASTDEDDAEDEVGCEARNVSSDITSLKCQGKQERKPRSDGGWDTVLESQPNDPKTGSDGPGPSSLESLFAQPRQWGNPFLQDGEAGPMASPSHGYVAPTFCAHNPNGNSNAVDPFELVPEGERRNYDGPVACGDMALVEQSVVREQQLWMENQRKIIAKHLDGLTFDQQF